MKKSIIAVTIDSRKAKINGIVELINSLPNEDFAGTPSESRDALLNDLFTLENLIIANSLDESIELLSSIREKTDDLIIDPDSQADVLALIDELLEILIIANTSFNLPPIANDDAAEIAQGTVTILTPLDNDVDPEGEPLIIIDVTQPTNGAAVITPDQLGIEFTPEAGFLGEQSFSYTIADREIEEGRQTASGNITITTLDLPPPVVETPEEQVQVLSDELQTIIDDNLGTPLEDKLQDALDSLQTALDELNKTPPDNQAAVGNIEDAIGDLEAAVNEELDPGVGTQLMDTLAGIARQLAVNAIDEAVAAGGDSGEISDAQQSLADGDALRTSGDYKDAVNKYKDALSKAESALP